jgi:hypothetical protein
MVERYLSAVRGRRSNPPALLALWAGELASGLQADRHKPCKRTRAR